MFDASTHLMGIFLALLAAAVWGSGDYAGGQATRRTDQFQVLALAAVSGMVLLILLATIIREPWPGSKSLLWAVAAGAAGALGLAALYRGLAIGSTAVVAPTAAVIGASLPVLFGFLTEGLLRGVQMGGIVTALLGLWLVGRTKGGHGGGSSSGFGLAALAGCGFAGFLIMIAQVEDGSVLAPLAVARVATLLVAVALLGLRRTPLPRFKGSGLALLAGVLDALGNLFYVLAKQYTRLDIVAVSASIYPAVTVVLAWLLAKQAVNRVQWTGVIFCLVGVALIAS